jgi:hypothetical protein
MPPLLTDSIGPSARPVLDVGCNEGVFARVLARSVYFSVKHRKHFSLSASMTSDPSDTRAFL